jgi:serine/threonine-protein kinase
MGEVFRARDPRLDRVVAIKALPEGFSKDPERLARFEREAKLLASLNHPNIAGIHGIEEQDGERFLILEFVEGESLAQRLARGPLAIDDAIDVCRQVATALEAAHESGIVHRDLKPGNIMLTPAGDAKVLDFGLAKAAAPMGSASSANLSASPTMTYAATMAGAILGTAAYMSPEQARGKPVDRRTDIWSFGCVLFECLSGRMVFSGETVSDMVAQILKSEPDWRALPEATPSNVRRLLALCLRKDPRERLRDVGDARLELGAADAEPPASAARPKRGAWWPMALAGLIAGAAVSAFVWPLLHPGAPPTAVREASLMLPFGQRLAVNGANNFMAISPDGRAVAFAARSGGEIQIHVRRLDTREDTVLPGTEDARDLFFSPDGDWVGYFDTQFMRKVSVHGGEPVSLAPVTEDRGGVWLKDGSIIAALGPADPLMRVPRDGGTPVAVTHLDSTRNERTHRWPTVLGTGEWIAFTVGLKSQAGDYDGCTIDAVSLKTGERRTLLREARRAMFVAPNHMVFDRKGTLFAVRVDPDDPKITDEPVPVLAGVAGDPSTGASFVDVSSDGTLAWVPQAGGRTERQLGWFDRDGRWTASAVAPADYRATSVSPDGKRILLLNGGSGSADLLVADLATGSLQQITTSHSVIGGTWTPDGQHVVYTCGNEKGEWLLVTQRIDGAGGIQKILTEPNIITVGGVTPDGAQVLYSGWGGRGARMRMASLRGDGRVELIPGAASPDCYEIQGMVSPDGKLVAFVSNVTGHEAVYIRRVDGIGGVVQVSTRGGGGMRWGRDGAELFFVEGEILRSVSVTRAGDEVRVSTPKPLFEVPPSPIQAQIRDHSYDPHTDRFYFLRPREGTDERREIALSLGWGAHLDDRSISAKEKR